MKQFILLFAAIAVLFTACQNNEDEVQMEEIGVVIDYAGGGDCGFVIELENGNRIQPLYYPDGFTLSHGQRVHIEYVEIQNVISPCDKGVPAEITSIEELDCARYVDLYFSNYDSLSRDPVFIHGAFVDGDCLQIKLSYSGGCREHTIDLARMHPWISGNSGLPTFEIRHNANGDLCEAWFTKELRFDISPIKKEGIKEFILTAKLSDGTMYNEVFKLQ